MSKTERIAAHHLGKMEKSAIALEQALEKISHFKRLNTTDRLKSAQSSIREVQKKLSQADEDVRDYRVYIVKNSNKLKQEKLNHYIDIVGLFNDDLTKKRNSVKNYLSAMDNWLDYSTTHYIRLKEGSASHRRNYDRYLVMVNRRLEDYNAANDKYHRFVKSLLNQHPHLTKYFKSQYKTMKKEMGWL
ncbi:MAG: hypothetical protein HUN04_04520 [Desulfobacter sp.]|nr:MAG: hypothetical protein HUN04_04520 [Desulfobacter sp.]